MRFTNTCDYAIRALIYLVRRHSSSEYALIAEVARECHIPKKYLEQVLLSLGRAGILESKKGHHGGYRLAKPPTEISLGDALRAVNGRLVPLPAWVESRDARSNELAQTGLGQVLIRMRDVVREVLDNATLADLDRGNVRAPHTESIRHFYQI